MTLKGQEQFQRNMDQLSKTVVPKASAQAVNRVTSRSVTASVARVAREEKVARKLIRKRVRLRKATAKKPTATMRVFRRDMPAINLGQVRTRLGRKGAGSRKGGSVLTVGRHKFPGGFVQQLKNGRWHIMARQGKARYPIDVVKIPMNSPLTQAFESETKKLMGSDLPKELAAALKKQFETALISKKTGI